MGSKLIDRKTMNDIINAKDISTIIAILFHGEFKEDIEEFGGLEIKNELIDFALSKNLAKNVGKLVHISPSTERKLIRAIVGKWDIYNVKLLVEAKERHQSYEAIARYIIDYGRYDATAAKEAMREESVEGLLSKLMINSPYADILRDALESYKKSKSGAEAIATIDKSYFKSLGNVIVGLRVTHNESARIIKMDIDMKNILYMLKAKHMELKFSEISGSMIERGNIGLPELEQIYNGSKDVETMALQIKAYDLKNAVDVYKQSKVKQLLVFEIGLRNAIFERSMSLLRHSMLTFGTILAYAYMKEIEIFTLRVLINSRIYGLSKEETSRLIVWKTE
jgi:vacuolar-type H+-ATPase subunit C/Vma6